MIKGILFLMLLITPPSNAKVRINIDVSREYDDTYTEEVDPFAPRGLRIAYESSVVIQSIGADGTGGIGSGNYFRLGKHRFVLTAAHVVDGDNEIVIAERGINLIAAKVVYLDNDHDIAILIPEENLKYTKPVRFRRDINNQIGEKIYHCGHPAMEGWHVSQGLLSGIDSKVLMFSTFAWPGSSGSVVFDEGGRVLGVVSSIRVDTPYGLPDMVEHIVLGANIKVLSNYVLKAALRDEI